MSFLTASMEDIAARIDAAAVAEIRNFLQIYTLGPSLAPDQITHRQDEKYGTVILPLWQQTDDFRVGTPHWPAFVRLLAALKPYAEVASALLSISHPEEVIKSKGIRERQLAAQDPAPATPHGSAEDCSKTVRLSANIAPTTHALATTHPSKLAAFAVIGRGLFTGGDLALPALDMRHTLKPGNHVVFHTAFDIHNTPFSGERYELQFFLPDLEE